MFQWHFRSAADLNLPILNDPADYQHQMQFKKMTATRDKANNVQRWPTTALNSLPRCTNRMTNPIGRRQDEP
jgi:hypothetical protein